MSLDKYRVDELRAKRRKLTETREQKRLRVSYGQKYVSAIAEATERLLVLDDFDENAYEPMHVEWPENIADAPGLVAAYIDKSSAAKLLTCFRERVGNIGGLIGFHDKRYLGLARIDFIEPISLLFVSEKTEDSVLLYVDDPSGIILVDCYSNPLGEPFSVVVQGFELAEALMPCFHKQLQFAAR